MSQRNYPCDTLIKAYFGETDLDLIGEVAFRQQLYLCMISQTLWMKGEIEMQRNRNTFGLLVWQLNEHWPTGGWGIVEYGPHSGMTGNVVGGRWKPLMYLLKRTLFRDVVAACGHEGLCYCRNDGNDFTGIIEIQVYDFKSGMNHVIEEKRIKLKGRGSIGAYIIKSVHEDYLLSSL